MSKSWAPAPDSLPTHSTKVRVIGADTPEAQAVLDSHWGQVSQYINAQHQRAQLSGLPQHKSSSTIGGVRITYTNNNGQDTVVVEVAASKETSESQEQKPSRYYAWALIEFEIVGVVSAGTDYSLFADLTTQINGQQVYSFIGSGLASSDLILRFAEYAESSGQLLPTASTIHADVQRSSLLVDLRKFAHPGTISVNLYAQVDSSPVAGYSGFSGQPMATVSAVLLDHNPFDMISQTLAIDPAGVAPNGTSAPNQVTYDLWENSKIYPLRQRVGIAPHQLPVPVGPFPGGGTPENKFTMPKVGTVTLTPSLDGAGFNLSVA